MGLRGPELDLLETAALLHDVGKLAVDRNLLRKRGRLSFDEYRRVQTHTTVVGDLLGGIGFLGKAIPIIGEHHRYFDGTPYGDTAAAGDASAGHELSLQAIDVFLLGRRLDGEFDVGELGQGFWQASETPAWLRRAVPAVIIWRWTWRSMLRVDRLDAGLEPFGRTHR